MKYRIFKALLLIIGIAPYTTLTHAQNVGINVAGNTPNSSAALDIDFSDRGFLLPRMTTTERDAIASPALSLQIFNTTTNCLQMYMGSSWANIVCDCLLPGSFSASAASNVQKTQFDANWASANTATEYFLDVATDINFTTFVSGFENKNVGNVITHTVTGITCGTTYYYRLRANNTCGEGANSNTITATSTSCCASSTTVVEVTSGGEIWMDRNLGATQAATSSTDAASYGDLYQWGRCTDGHEIRTSGTTSTNSTTDTPGHANFILEPSTPFDWRTPQNNNLWQGGSGVNNPCPSGFRVPTSTELDAERLSWSSNNSAGAFASPLKLPLPGYRTPGTGTLTAVNTGGRCLSSTVAGISAWNLHYVSTESFLNPDYRAFGFPVRCIKDD